MYCSSLGIIGQPAHKYRIMPRLSLYRPNKTNDYRFFDKTISEMYTVGGLDIYVHKYLGPKTGTGDSAESGNFDATQPNYTFEDPLFIQDLFLLENRDRAYDPDIYRMRGVYRIQDIDFDLTQFGLFLNNDTLFITFHYNDMIDTFGRKLMSGDVLEVPNLQDPNPLNAAIAKALPKYYVIQDGSFASEGFSQTWLPHLWRVKATPMVNAQEYQDIINKPFETENIWDPGNFYSAGTIVNNGNTYYRAKIDTPVDTPITDTVYWEEITDPTTIADVASTRNKDLEINDALLAQAEIDVPLSGYDTVKFFILPTNADGTPATPIGVTADGADGEPTVTFTAKYTTGTVTRSGEDPVSSAIGVVFPSNPQANDYALRLDFFPSRLFQYNGTTWVAEVLGESDTITFTASGLTNDYDLQPVITPVQYSLGTLTIGTASPIEAAIGIDFPVNPSSGDYSLRLDYFPNRLYQFDSTTWMQQSLSDTETVSYTLTPGETITEQYSIGSVTISNQAPITAAIGIAFPVSPSIDDYALRLDFFPSRLYQYNGSDWILQVLDTSDVVTFAATGAATITVDSTFINSSEAAVSPRANGYTLGYLTGDGIAPNGLPVTPGISFPVNPSDGQYCLRLDYFPNRLFRYNGNAWVKIEDNVRTNLTNGPSNQTLRSSFVNNTYTVPTTDVGNIPSRQSLSEILRPRADNGDDNGNKPANPRPGTQPGQSNN